MKRKTIKTLAVLMALAMVLAVLTGCGGNNTNNSAQSDNAASANNTVPANNTEPANTTPANNTEPGNNSNNVSPDNTVVPDNTANNVDPANTVDPSNTVDPTNTVDPDAITVSSAEDLLEAIKPGAKITIAAGSYNLSEYLAEAAKNADEFNTAHQYVRLQPCNDGVELAILNADGLSIKGGTGASSDTVILVDPRYADVMVFSGGSGIRLANLTMGHTPDKGSCEGDVLHFRGTKNIELNNLDLFGCGTYALRADTGSSTLHADGCTLRDCSEGAIYIEDCTGDFVFENCVMSGSDSYPYFDTMMPAKLYLKKCRLGLHESEWFPYGDNIELEDCELDENAELPPDYEPGAAFSPADLVFVNAKEMELPANCYGYVMTDVDTDILDAELNPYFDIRNGNVLEAYMGVYTEGKAEITGYFNAPVQYSWTYTDNGCLDLQPVNAQGTDAASGLLSFFKSGPEGYELYWAKLEVDIYAIWFQIL